MKFKTSYWSYESLSQSSSLYNTIHASLQLGGNNINPRGIVLYLVSFAFSHNYSSLMDLVLRKSVNCTSEVLDTSNSCNMGMRDLPDMYALSPWACGPRAYISGKSREHMLQVICITSDCGFC